MTGPPRPPAEDYPDRTLRCLGGPLDGKTFSLIPGIPPNASEVELGNEAVGMHRYVRVADPDGDVWMHSPDTPGVDE